MTTTTTPAGSPYDVSPGRARTAPRPGHLVAGLLLLAAAVVAATTWGTGVSSVLVFALLPDVALLAAAGAKHAPGQLPARAVPLYNLLHHPAVPAALLLAGAAGLLGSYWLVAGLAWAAHIAVDRGVGYGLRTRDGWQRG
jgi:hypothetical protein